MVVGCSSVDNGKGLKQYPSTRKRTLAVMMTEDIVNKMTRAEEMLVL